MFDSPVSKISKEELENITSGKVDFVSKMHKPIPAIIFDPITNNEFKTLQISDLPLEITSYMNFPPPKEWSDLKDNDFHDIIATDMTIIHKEIFYYMTYNIKENFIYKLVYEIFPDYNYICSIREIFDNIMDNECQFDFENILSVLFNRDDPLDIIPDDINEDNLSDKSEAIIDRKSAKIEIATRQLTSMYGYVICKAADIYIDNFVVPDILASREKGIYKPVDIIDRIYKEHMKLVHESPVAHVIAIKNYTREMLGDFIMDLVQNICQWALVNSANTFYFASYDYYKTEISKSNFDNIL